MARRIRWDRILLELTARNKPADLSIFYCLPSNQVVVDNEDTGKLLLEQGRLKR